MLGRPVSDVDAAVFAPGRFTTTYAGAHADPTVLSADYGVCWQVDTAFGRPPYTLDDAAVTATFMGLVGPVIPVPQAEALVVAVHELPSAPSIQPLIDLLSVSV